MNNNNGGFTRKARELLGLIDDARETLAEGNIPALKSQIGVIEKGVSGAIRQFNDKVTPLLKNIKSGNNIQKTFFGGYSLRKTPRISEMDEVLQGLQGRANAARNANARAQKAKNEANANANARARQAANAKRAANAERNRLAKIERNKLKNEVNKASLAKTLNALKNRVGNVNVRPPPLPPRPVNNGRPTMPTPSNLMNAKSKLRPVVPPLSANRSARIANAARNALGASPRPNLMSQIRASAQSRRQRISPNSNSNSNE